MAFLGPITCYSASHRDTDTVKVAARAAFNKKSGIHKALFGKNYRELWATPVSMRVVHIATEKGGLSITGLGGGKQTRSLQLNDSAGHEWVLRTVDKYPERGLPKFMRHTIVRDVLKDRISTSNPYAALTVPPMAGALGIPHMHPEIVFMPDDPALGRYRKEFGNQVLLLEERRPIDSTKTKKTEKVQEALEKGDKARVDQKLLLRARLLDMIIGDWDRHAGQWLWEMYKDSSGIIYEPLPHDRDKVYYTSSGLFSWIGAKLKPQWQSFGEHIKHVKKWNLNNIYFDLHLLNELDRRDWDEQIEYIQHKLSDSIINAAVKLLPPDIYAICGRETTRKIIARRNNIKANAMEYYRFLSRSVDIPGSEKDEKFFIKQEENGAVSVKVNRLKKDSMEHVLYERKFDPGETKEIRLFGLGGDDVFSLSGEQSGKIIIRMIGGEGHDVFLVDSALKQPGKHVIYDRSDEKNSYPVAHTAKLLVSTDSSVNTYNKRDFKFNHFGPLVSLGYNTEDGVRLIAGYIAEKHRFRMDPYLYRQELQVGYTLSKKSFIITYKADFKKAVGDNDLGINILSRGPRNVSNFFGLGNETVFVNQGNQRFDYYRNRYDYIFTDVRLYHRLGKWQVSGGVIGQYYTSSAANNGSKFFNEYNHRHPELNLFSTKVYAGLITGVNYDTRNSSSYPTIGVYWKNTLNSVTGITITNHTNGQLLSEFSFYLNPDKDSVLTIANRTGAGHFFGRGEFFQMMNLGGMLSLQGFHTSRFIGNSMVFNDLELRLKLFDFNNYVLAGKLGMIVFNDAGRVWLDGESSNTIHDSYGGGLFITPYNKVILTAVIGHSSDGNLLYLTTGFRF
jgi:hypothetical protein